MFYPAACLGDKVGMRLSCALIELLLVVQAVCNGTLEVGRNREHLGGKQVTNIKAKRLLGAKRGLRSILTRSDCAIHAGRFMRTGAAWGIHNRLGSGKPI